MPKFTIEVEAKEISCCVCLRKEQLTPTAVEVFFPRTDLWRVTSNSYPKDWKPVGADIVCPSCWADFLQFATAKTHMGGAGDGGGGDVVPVIPATELRTRYSVAEGTGETYNKIFMELRVATMGKPEYDKKTWDELEVSLEAARTKQKLDDILTTARAVLSAARKS